MRLIDADTLKKDLKDNYIYFGETQLLDDFYKALDEQPTVQAVPIEELQEIRQEIDSHCSDNRDRNDGLYIAMKIIDKYRAESEDVDGIGKV